MINNQNLAVLSEKVAYLESVIKNLASASGISYDNTGSGLAADDVQEAIDEVADNFYIENIESVTENVISCGSDQTASYTTPAKGWYRAVIINTGGPDVSLRVNGKSFAYLNVQGRYEMIIPLASGVALTATVVGNGAIYLSKFNF